MKVSDAIVLDKNRIAIDIDLLTVALVHNVDSVEIAKLETKLATLKNLLEIAKPLEPIIKDVWEASGDEFIGLTVEEYIEETNI